jgi:8-oxo-dGTP diphosphatase
VTRFEILAPQTRVEFDSITAVVVLPFTDSGEIVSITNSRGLDVPGGHVEEGETSIEQVACREAMEEAGIALSHLKLIAYLQSSVLDRSGAPTHIAVLAGRAELLPDGASMRAVLPVSRFLEHYAAGDPALMGRLVELAISV